MLNLRPCKGFRFLHSRVLNEAGQPQRFEVTKSTKAMIFYRPLLDDDDTMRGAPQKCTPAEFPTYRLKAVE